MSWLSKILNKAHLMGKLSPEHLVFRWVIVLGSLFLLTIVGLLWYAGVSTLAVLTLLPVLVILWLSIALRVKNLLQQHFYSLANVVESLRMGEFSMRIATDNDKSAWRDVFQELNLLAQSTVRYHAYKPLNPIYCWTSFSLNLMFQCLSSTVIKD